MAENLTPTAETESAPVEAAPAPEAATAPVQTPAPAPVQAPSAPVIQRVGSDLTPELQPVNPDEPRKEVADGRAYEITYIVIANNPEALDSSQKSVKALIENGGGAVDNVRVSEVRRLSYPIAKRTEGIYVVINARFSKALTESLERFFKLDEGVLRHIILREDS
ncbi:MAG TPA: 30S ribosomal protein S6 [Abditibacterium sp.]